MFLTNTRGLYMIFIVVCHYFLPLYNCSPHFSVSSSVSSLAQAEAAKAEVAKRLDTEGFTVVKRARRRGEEDDDDEEEEDADLGAFGHGVSAAPASSSLAARGVGSAAARDKHGKKKKKKKAALFKTDFYAFQKKENKVSRLEALRMAFDEDKKKIAQLRDARVFKPY